MEEVRGNWPSRCLAPRRIAPSLRSDKKGESAWRNACRTGLTLRMRQSALVYVPKIVSTYETLR